MGKAPRIAIDAMGGDVGVPVMIAGAALALEQRPKLKFLLVGDQKAIKAELKEHPQLRKASDILDAPDMVSGEEKPSRALRMSKTSSMGLALQAVKDGSCDACLSGGNTGAYMAMALFMLRTLPGIDRPALAARLPARSEDRDVIMLDLGANSEVDASNLVQFAIMGAAYARTSMGIENPKVGLLNIGTEEGKGTDEIREASATMRALTDMPFTYVGYAEGDKIPSGDFDVIVSDGFSGNIALKTLEGTARFVTDLLKQAFRSSIRSKFGFLISRPATELLRHHLDPNNHNGGVLLGVNGLVMKSHGSANVKGVANAIGVTAAIIDRKLLEQVTADLDRMEKKGQ